MFQFSRYSAYHGSSKSFSVKFRARSLSFLVGIHLNIYYFPSYYKRSKTNIITKLSSQDDGNVQEYVLPICECIPDKLLKLCPPFTIPLNPNVNDIISLILEESTSDLQGRKVDRILVSNDMKYSGRRLQIIDSGLKSEIPFISSLRIA